MPIVRPVHFIPPILALAIGGGLVGAQRNSITELEAERAVLRKHIEAAESRPEPTRPEPRPGRTNQPDTDKETIDWKEMAEAFAEMQRTGGVSDMRKLMSFQTRLQGMDENELAAALEEIAKLELGEMESMMLESMLVMPLIQKDPELALTRFSDRIGNETSALGMQLASALGEWAKKDVTAATAWFDREIAAGTFDSKSLDGKSSARASFEGSLINALLGTNPKAAEARVAAMPADQRKEIFLNGGLTEMGVKDHEAFASLVRSQIPEDERNLVFGNEASSIAMRGDLEKVGEFLDRIGASPVERNHSAAEAAKSSIRMSAFRTKITAEKIDSMRDWLGIQTPGAVEKITGEAIGGTVNLVGAMKFSDASEMVLKYHAESGSDDLLTGFLSEVHTFQNKAEARKVAEKISDPGKRAEALENLN